MACQQFYGRLPYNVGLWGNAFWAAGESLAVILQIKVRLSALTISSSMIRSWFRRYFPGSAGMSGVILSFSWGILKPVKADNGVSLSVEVFLHLLSLYSAVCAVQQPTTAAVWLWKHHYFRFFSYGRRTKWWEWRLKMQSIWKFGWN